MRRRTMLGAIALGVGGAAVAGYGAAMGRDAWRATRRNAGFVLMVALLACAIVMPFLGGRNLTRGYPEGQPSPIFTSILLIVGGGVLAMAFTGILSLYVTVDHYVMLGGLVAVSASAGLFYGAMQKPQRLRTFAIAEHNEQFLEEHSFEELDGKEVTHVDGEGNPLRLMEHNASRIVFMAVGRRSRRAYITLSPKGEMLDYSGIIPITEMR